MNLSFFDQKKGTQRRLRIFMSVIEKITHGIITGKIPFPYQRLFVESPEVMFNRLKNYLPEFEIHQGYPRNYYAKNKLYLFKRFRVIIDTTKYWEMNVLSDIFNEDVRLQGKPAYESTTGKDGWINLAPEMALIFSKIPELKIALINHIDEIAPLTTVDYKKMSMLFFQKIRLPTSFKLTWIVGLLTIGFNIPINPVKNTHSKMSSFIQEELEGKRWLDISAGYGDRLSVACAYNMIYHGYDPNFKLRDGHNEIIKRFGDSKHQHVTYEPFEDAILPDNFYDVVLSSPPFYFLEEYTTDETQSIIRFPQFEQWVQDFLFKSVRKAWQSLKIGGVMILHLSDIRNYSYCEALNLFIEDLPGSCFQEMVGVVGNKKYFNEKQKTDDMVKQSEYQQKLQSKPSPVWIWQKGNPNLCSTQRNRLKKFYPEFT